MISRKYETVVGLFVVAALAALLVMVVIVAQEEGLWQDYVEYKAIFKNVAGLKKGSEVRLAGVKVGTVTDINIGAKGEITVSFQVLGKYQNQIREDTKASVGYSGLLGDRTLDIKPGSQNVALVKPGGEVKVTEPRELTDILDKVEPYMQDLGEVLTNLKGITKSLTDPEGNVNKMITQIREMVETINQGKGSLGLLINDPALYRQTSQSMASAAKILKTLEGSRGLLGAMVNDPALKGEAKKVLGDLAVVAANLKKVTIPFKDAAEQLPGLAKKVGSFLENLDKAGEGLPDLVVSGQDLMGDAGQVAQAAKRSWFFRRYISKPQERTIRVEKEIK